MAIDKLLFEMKKNKNPYENNIIHSYGEDVPLKTEFLFHHLPFRLSKFY